MKLYLYSFNILLALLLFSGCEDQKRVKSGSLEFDGSVSEIKSDKEFTISLPSGHPDKLAIVTPDDVWFYIQEDGDINHLMPKNEFMKADIISIHPSTLKGTSWINGKSTISLVFAKKGKYSIYLSDNLETEIENSLTFIKSIKFID